MRLKDLERRPVSWHEAIRGLLWTAAVALLLWIAYMAGSANIAGLSMRGIDNAEYYYGLLQRCQTSTKRTIHMIWEEDESFHELLESIESLPAHQTDK